MLASVKNLATSIKIRLQIRSIKRKSRLFTDAIRTLYSCISYYLIYNSDPKKNWDENIYKRNFVAALVFCGTELSGENTAIYEADKEIIDAQAAKAESLSKCVQWRNQILNVLLFYQNWIRNEAEAQKCRASLTKYKAAEETITWRVIKDIRSEVRSQFKEIRRWVRDERATKVGITAQDIYLGLAVVSPFFIVSGYLYDHYFLSNYGIDTSVYFTLSDYLASSIEHIRVCVFSSLFALISVFVGVHTDSLDSPSRRKQSRKEANKKLFLIYLSAMFPFALLGSKDSYAFYWMAYITTYFIFLRLIPSFAERFFDDRLRTKILILFIGVYALNIYINISNTQYLIERDSGANQLEAKYNIDGADLTGYKLLTANSSFVFFYNPVLNKTLVLPKAKLSSVLIETGIGPLSNGRKRD